MTLQELMNAAQNLSWQEQLHLATRLLQWAEAQRQESSSTHLPVERKPDLHPGVFILQEDFDEPLPDAFWLGES